MLELMRLPRFPSLPSATELGGATRILPLNDEPILAGRTGFEPVALFADNEAATLAAPRPPRMVPVRAGMVGSRGFEPRSARSERAASANCATSRRRWLTGPSGWTRTTTARVKSPACCVDTTEGLIWFGLRVSNPSLRAGNAECSSTPRPNAGRWGSPAQSPFRQLSKNPLLRAGGALEARMPPLHHAAVPLHVSNSSR